MIQRGFNTTALSATVLFQPMKLCCWSEDCARCVLQALALGGSSRCLLVRERIGYTQLPALSCRRVPTVDLSLQFEGFLSGRRKRG